MTEDNKATTKKTAPKKTTKRATKSTVKKTAAKKATVKKPAVKKPAVKKVTVKKVSTSKKPAAKKTAAKKAAPKKPIQDDPLLFTSANNAENTASEKKTFGKKPASTDEDADNVFPGLAKDRDWQSFALRVAYIITFGVLGWLAFGAAITMTIIQVVITVLLGAPNETLQSWVCAIGKYLAEVFEYVSWRTDEKPFPLGRPVPLK